METITTGIVLGETYTDKNTGFTGVAVCITKWQFGCLRVTLQPKVGDDGKLPGTETFDEPALIGVPYIDDSGGPRPEPKQKPTPTR